MSTLDALPAPPASVAEPDAPPAKPSSRAFLALAVGSAGVVYGDIGTSPLYAFKESITHLRGGPGGLLAHEVTGVVSLMLWTLMMIVTLKYVLILMRFDNRGEGGVLSLMALVQRAGAGGRFVMAVGMLGAGLFFGDAMLTPAISVLSAVEGLKVVDGLAGRIDPYVAPLSLAVLAGLFAVQRWGTGGVGRWFGPVCIVWFAVLAALGLRAIADAPQVLAALNPLEGLALLGAHPFVAPVVLGSVFLTVTGAEALYADMGHFGRRPIQAAWAAIVLPSLALNYLGQGALTLADPSAAENPFFLLAPEGLQLPLVILAAAATVIASQAVISGAFSLAQQAVQLGLLPRLKIQATSEHHPGQIYAPQVNAILAAGVAGLILGFGSSGALANAYGVAVVGAMITSTVLAVIAVQRLKRLGLGLAILAFSPFLVVEGGFLAANLIKVAHGGFVSLIMAAVLIAVMAAWVRGRARLSHAEQSDLEAGDVAAMLAARPPMRARGTAVFLTSEADKVPASLLHNLKHNQVLHEQVVLLTVRASRRPRVPDAERVEVRDLAAGFKGLTLWFGYMEAPNVARGLSLARTHGLKFDIMRTSFFVSRRSLVLRGGRGLGRLADRLFALLLRNAERAADYFGLPPSRVVELGAQVVL